MIGPELKREGGPGRDSCCWSCEPDCVRVWRRGGFSNCLKSTNSSIDSRIFTILSSAMVVRCSSARISSCDDRRERFGGIPPPSSKPLLPPPPEYAWCDEGLIGSRRSPAEPEKLAPMIVVSRSYVGI